MKLYIVRHGIAVELGEQGVERDADRVLSAEGRKRTRDAARGLAALRCRPVKVLGSPLARARETAEILAEEMEVLAAVEECDLLAPGVPPGELIRALGRHTVAEIMVVGHMPDLALLASELLCSCDALDITFKRAAVCCIAADGPLRPGMGRLEWLLQPRHLRMLASHTTS